MTNDFHDDDAVCELNYLKHVRYLAAAVVDDFNEPLDEDSVDEAFFRSTEAASNSSWLCSTLKCQSLLLWSKNKNAIFDVDADWMTGAESIQHLSERAALYALGMDVYQEVRQTLYDMKDA